MNKYIREGRPRVFLTGVGGQGTLTATRLLAMAAMNACVPVVSGEVHGMAQRGGVVESSLLFNGWRAPRIDYGEADIILGFEPLETLRALDYLAENGVIFSSTNQIPPPSVNLGQDIYPDMDEIRASAEARASDVCFIDCNALAKEAGSLKCAPVVLLGALCASALVPVSIENLEAAITSAMREDLARINLKALFLGAESFKP